MNYIPTKSYIKTVLFTAQEQFVDADGNVLPSSLILEDVNLSRHAFYSLFDDKATTSKSTAIKIAFAFETSSEQLAEIVNSCGYFFPFTKADRLIADYFDTKNFEPEKLDEILEANNENPLFSKFRRR